MIRANGALKHPASGTKVTDVTIDHRLSTGVGEAILDVPGIRFGAGLQPEELTRLTEGVIALVNGTVSGRRAGSPGPAPAKSPRPAISPPTTWISRRRSGRSPG